MFGSSGSGRTNSDKLAATMTELSRAVFLSYASQDAEAARRGCDALQSSGIEVWFDQSELRGGDSWDRQILKQIRECALFVPVISLNTQARLEGYFRREWRLAVDRTRDMADGKPFLVPVVVDGTNDRDAAVPDLFRSVQWTRLPAGETPLSFVAHIARLLSPDRPTATALRPVNQAVGAHGQHAQDPIAGSAPVNAGGQGPLAQSSGANSRAKIALPVGSLDST